MNIVKLTLILIVSGAVAYWIVVLFPKVVWWTGRLVVLLVKRILFPKKK